MAIDFGNMNINPDDDDIYAIELRSASNQNIASVDKTFADFEELHAMMSKKRKNVSSLKFKKKLPSNPLKRQRSVQRHEEKIEIYLKALIKNISKHQNQIFKKEF